MKSSIIESIKSLPPLSKTIIDINRVYADEEAGIGDLAKVIEGDPMIVANLLKNANSPLYGFGKEIRNVTQAVSLFGMSMTRSIALGNSVRKLLNVDMQPYGITSEKFAEVSAMQATLIRKWYSKVDKQKADKLYLAAFLQETGKILIASDVIQEDEDVSFKSEAQHSNNLAQVEKSYVDVTSAEVTAEVFQHWGFDTEFVEMIHYADNPSAAPDEMKEYSTALNIVKTVLPVNAPLSEQAINFGLRHASDAGYDENLLQETINDMLDAVKASS
ncbi:HDOD domain-containing protein [Sulfurimonas autotrophica]|uniref:Putative signal transduction protein n=1 Tax=Sulfurimonas autotrophica (strain ATCC BAA-671 / DSM 16294 / JCM 11897 / OK10) TaxID=563040 RepID=E0UTV7_SULAO|nr:HDOD domain-containing protein [Sulfurimonas autotrophica]ADN09401.1 putative signal transduction protein [Sulfurimonas autotrophica DSM 16294]